MNYNANGFNFDTEVEGKIVLTDFNEVYVIFNKPDENIYGNRISKTISYYHNRIVKHDYIWKYNFFRTHFPE